MGIPPVLEIAYQLKDKESEVNKQCGAPGKLPNCNYYTVTLCIKSDVVVYVYELCSIITYKVCNSCPTQILLLEVACVREVAQWQIDDNIIIARLDNEWQSLRNPSNYSIILHIYIILFIVIVATTQTLYNRNID